MELPSVGCQYADVETSESSRTVTATCAITPSQQDPCATSVVDYLSINNQAWVWKYLEEDANHAEMARALEHGNITAVMDGSYFPKRDKT